MNFRTIALASALVTLLFGLAFVLIPVTATVPYRMGLHAGPPGLEHMAMTRNFGVGFLLVGAACWGMRALADASVQRSVAQPVALACFVGAVVTAHGTLTGAVNAMGWSSVLLFAIFGLLWARLGWGR